MNIFRLLPPLFNRFRHARPSKPVQDGKLHCSECGGSIRRHDRYIILTARHRDCGDPKLVGQKNLLPLIEPAPQSPEYVRLSYLDANDKPVIH